MIKMNIVQRVDIEPITQAQLEKMIREKIAEQNSSIIVDKVEFIQKRTPSRIEAEVTASFAGNTPVQSLGAVLDARETLGAVVEPEVTSNPVQAAVEKGGTMAGTAVEDNLFPDASASEEPSVLDSQASDTAIIDEVLGAEPESSGDVADMFNLPK